MSKKRKEQRNGIRIVTIFLNIITNSSLYYNESIQKVLLNLTRTTKKFHKIIYEKSIIPNQNDFSHESATIFEAYFSRGIYLKLTNIRKNPVMIRNHLDQIYNAYKSGIIYSIEYNWIKTYEKYEERSFTGYRMTLDDELINAGIMPFDFRYGNLMKAEKVRHYNLVNSMLTILNKKNNVYKFIYDHNRMYNIRKYIIWVNYIYNSGNKERKDFLSSFDWKRLSGICHLNKRDIIYTMRHIDNLNLRSIIIDFLAKHSHFYDTRGLFS